MQLNIMNLAAKAAQNAPEVEKAAEKAADATSSIQEILLIALVGFATVFVVLIVLMGIIILVSKMFGEKKPKAAAPVKQDTAPAPTTASDERVDSYTGVKLIGVSDKDAALIMAIVADGLDKPLDNLRFISIKEVK